MTTPVTQDELDRLHGRIRELEQERKHLLAII